MRVERPPRRLKHEQLHIHQKATMSVTYAFHSTVKNVHLCSPPTDLELMSIKPANYEFSWDVLDWTFFPWKVPRFHIFIFHGYNSL